MLRDYLQQQWKLAFIVPKASPAAEVVLRSRPFQMLTEGAKKTHLPEGLRAETPEALYRSWYGKPVPSESAFSAAVRKNIDDAALDSTLTPLEAAGTIAPKRGKFAALGAKTILPMASEGAQQMMQGSRFKALQNAVKGTGMAPSVKGGPPAQMYHNLVDAVPPTADETINSALTRLLLKTQAKAPAVASAV